MIHCPPQLQLLMYCLGIAERNMTISQLEERLSGCPKMCPTWVAAVPLKHDGGVVYLSDISEDEERIGMTHIYIWDKADMGSPDNVRKAFTHLMHEHNLDRLVGEIDIDNKLAINLVKKSGFHEIGIIRHRKRRSGGVHNVLLMDALPGDLDG